MLELAHLFEMPQPGISHHLKILTAAGLLVTRREGNSIYYRRALLTEDAPLSDLHRELYRAVERLAVRPEVEARIEEIHRKRASHSRDFFRRNAESFRQNQGMIAQLDQYGKQVEDIIGHIGHGHSDRRGTVMEVGPGEGELLLLMSRLFARVIALDNSPEMLERARRAVRGARRHNVTFIEGEIARAIDEAITVDLLVLNMVLHHMPGPSAVFQQASRLLAEHGALLIIDLCPHDQDWVRESCGDLWLGFDAQDLERWAARANLAKGQSAYLALRNGFQIQMQIFHPAKREFARSGRSRAPAAQAIS